MKILLVEDNSPDASLLVELLKEEGVTEVFCAADGYEALDYVYQREPHKNAWRPDVILLDLGLPRISGYAVLFELKKQPQYTNIPVIILTASRKPFDREQCEALGVDSFLYKPHNLKEYEELAHQLATMRFPPKKIA